MNVRPSTEDSYHERIRRVTRHLQEHLDEKTDLDVLAAVACFSPYHFHRVFKGIVGESVAEHVRRLKLERAANRLWGTALPVTELAFEAGYDTLEAFIRAFRRQFGLPPSVYRRMERQVRLDDRGTVRTLSPSEALAHLPEIAPSVVWHEPLTVAYVRHTGPYEECGQAWRKICRWAFARNLVTPRTLFVGLCHDSPEVTAPGHIRYDAAIALDRPVAPEGEVGVQEYPGGEFAVCLHRGPLARIKNTYAALGLRWFPRSGREMRWEPSLEVYLDDPERTPPEQLRVEIRVPLEPRA